MPLAVGALHSWNDTANENFAWLPSAKACMKNTEEPWSLPSPSCICRVFKQRTYIGLRVRAALMLFDAVLSSERNDSVLLL